VDSKVQLRLRSLAGEAYVQVFPGRSKRLIPSGGSLGLSQDEDYTEIDQILNEVSGSTEGRTREFVQGVGSGVAGEGTHLNQVVGGATSLISDSFPLTSTLAAQHRQVADIVQNLGNVMDAIGQRTEALNKFAQGSLVTFRAVAARDVALDHILVRLPNALMALQRVSTTVGSVTPHIAPVATNLGDTLTDLKPTIRELGPASRQGTEILKSLGLASPGLRGVLIDIDKLQPSAVAALPAIHAATCQLDPMIRYISPYGPDLGAYFDDWGGATDAYSQKSHEVLTSLEVDPAALVRGVSSEPSSAALTTLLDLGVFSKAGAVNGFDPARPPGGMEDVTDGRGEYTPAEYGATHKYTRVTEDCSK
jgi:phospholipid/cholesterol/gamma-HCH transport system substrate-binding protein